MRKKMFFFLLLIGIIYPNVNIAQNISSTSNEDKGTVKPNNVTSFEDLIVKGKLGVGLPDPKSAVHVNGGIIANDLILYSGLEIMDKNKNSQLNIAPNGHMFSNSKDGFKLRSSNNINLGLLGGTQKYNGQLRLTSNKIILNSLVGTDSPDMTLSSKGINVYRNMSLSSSLDVAGDISTNRLNINGTSLLTTSSLFRISNSSGISFGVSPSIGQIKEQLRITEGQVKIDALTELTYGLKIQSGNIVTDSDGTRGIEIEGNGDYIRSKQTNRFFINHAKELCLGVGGSVHSNQMAFKTDGIYVNRDMNIANSKISITGREDELADNLVISNSSITIDGERDLGGILVLKDNEVRLTSSPISKGGFVLKSFSGEDKLRIYSSGGYIHSNHAERLTINNTNSLRLGVGDSSSDYQMEFQPDAIVANKDVKLDNADLVVDGMIHCEKVKVDRSIKGGADFVFEDDYKLRPLSEVEAFVKENKHLPEIASEKTMKEEGLDMGDFQIQLLQKVEEMTLYIIELEKEIKEIKASIQK